MKYNYKVVTVGITQNPAFPEASVEELRVLLTLLSLEGAPCDEGDISRLAGVSGARCRAALAFWEGAGVLEKRRHEGIIEEFEERITLGTLDEEPMVEVAKTIRDENLATLIVEISALAGTPSLPDPDVKAIAGLVSQYGMSAEYILTLAAYMASKGELKVKRLRDRAIDLQRRDVDTVEELERYIEQKEHGYEHEYRRVMGIYGRSLSKDEREFFRRWAEDFGYSAEIVSEAYNIAVKYSKSGNNYFPYMDKILASWHSGGCRTVAECLAHSEATKPLREIPEKKYQKSKPETPRYGDFDVDEAFMNAIERSFSEEDD